MYSLIAMCDTFLILFFLPILQDIMQFYNMFLELKDLVTAQAFKVIHLHTLLCYGMYVQ